MDGTADQLIALLDLGRAFSDGDIAYALIGSIAVGIHSRAPRATQDIDIAVSTVVSRDPVVSVLTRAGFELRGQFAHSLNFRHPGGERVRVAIDPDFDGIVERAEPVEVGGIPISLVGRDDLIATKERAARDPGRRRSKALRDQSDVELLRGDVPEPDEGW